MKGSLGTPALWPALALLAGLRLEAALAVPPRPFSLLVLASLALATRSRWGPILAALAAGALIGAVAGRAGRELLSGIDAARPVEAVVRIAAPAQRREETWVAAAELQVLRQGAAVVSGRTRVWLTLAGAEPPIAGSVLRVRGYLAESSGFANLVETEAGPLRRLRVKSWQLAEVERDPGAVGRFQVELRRRVATVGRTAAGPALARALVLGDTRALSDDTLRGLRRTGLVHLLSLSGLHVAMLGGLVLLLSSPLGPVGQRLTTALAVTGYVLLAGPFPALLRAAAMGLLGLLAVTLRRPPAALNALAVAAALLAAFSPELLDDLGFQLSCSATAGLILFTVPIAERLDRASKWIASSLGATLGAQLASLPWALPALFTLSPVSALLNLVAVPWTAVMLAASLMWFALAWTAPELAGSMVPVLDLLAKPVELPAGLPPQWWVVTPWQSGFVEAVAVSLLALGLVLASSHWRCRLGLGIALLLLEGSGKGSDPGFEVVFFDVGQGDAILVRDGPSALLVDGGGMLGVDLGRRVLVPNLARLGVRRLAAVALTHPDLDHCGGLVDLAAYLPVDRLWLPGDLQATGCVGDLMRRFRGSTDRLAAGAEISLGRWALRVLSPPTSRPSVSENDRSLVLVAEGGGRRILLAGDLEAAGESDLLAADRVPSCDVLKVGHHGGANSTSRDWLAAARPRLAVISCGVRNRYAHPSRETLARLAARGIRVLRTDRDGMVILRWRPGGPLDLDLPASPR